MNGNGNGNGSWKSWALGVSGTLLMLSLTGAGWAYTQLAGRVDLVQATQAGRGERLARLEAEVSGVREDVKEIRDLVRELIRRRQSER